MADILQTALFEAEIDFDTDTVTNDVPENAPQMPQLQRMPTYANVPPSSSKMQTPQVPTRTITSKPLSVIRNEQVNQVPLNHQRVTTSYATSMNQPKVNRLNVNRVPMNQPAVNRVQVNRVPMNQLPNQQTPLVRRQVPMFRAPVLMRPQPNQRHVVTTNGRRFVLIAAPQQQVQRPLAMANVPQFSNRRVLLPQPQIAHIQPRRVPTPPTKQVVRKPVPVRKSSGVPQSPKVNRTAEWNKEHHEDIEDDEKLIQVDTFIEYTPLKLRSGLRHPDPVVETASLSSVSAPEITYYMAIPELIVDKGSISALQLEAALYACQAHDKILPSGERQGYLIGDGAGVGKGRTIAAIIYENWLRGRKRAIWVSVSSDLHYDAMRDLRDIGAEEINVYQLSSLKYAKIASAENGNIKKGVIFLTYSALVGEIRNKDSANESSNRITSRLDQLVQWCGEDYEGLIVFDECHHAKNLMTSSGGKAGTKTGKCVLRLQQELRSARVIYASATGATEPRDMAYMVRLGLWGPGQTFEIFGDFLKAVEDRGVGAMELVAMDMKLRGLYLARQLSFIGVDFSVKEVLLSNDFIQMYDESVKLWMEVRRQFQYAIEHTRTDVNVQTRTWASFWGAHQRFFKYLCIGAKVQECVKVAQQALRDGKCVVIGLQSTGESQTKHVLNDVGEITDFVSTTKAVLQYLIEKYFPTGDSGGSDIFEDMEKMHAIGSNALAPLKGGRKRRMNTSLMSTPMAKRRSHRNSTGSPNEDEQSTDNEDEEDSNASSKEDSELSSDDGFDDEGSDVDEEFSTKKAEDPLFKTLMGELDDEVEYEVDPFHHDFSTAVDPWAHLQTQEDEAFNAQERERLEEEKRQKLKLRRKLRKQKEREQLQKERDIAEARDMETQLLLQRKKDMNVASATDFMESTRVIDNALRNGDPLSLMTIKAELLTAVERLGKILPPNTLDQLIDELGGPQQVAEMTGRKGRIIILPNGQAEYQMRNADSDAPVDQMNMEEKDKFMRGEKLIAVISEAASSGISLQSDKRVPNQRRRVHITLELPWAGDKAIQQFGRTHRSNQANAPEYLFLISELAGEKRFASVVAKRLESLGALTHGDRRAAESRDFSQFNLDNAYGREALKKLVQTLANTTSRPIVPPPEDYILGQESFFDDMRQYLVGVGILSVNKQSTTQYIVEKEGATLSKFLNRLLGLPFHAQNALFSYFTNIIGELIKQAKANGTFDKGIMGKILNSTDKFCLDLGSGTDCARKLEHRVFRGFANNPNFVVEIHKIGAERGIKWTEAKQMFEVQADPIAGFYLSIPIPERKQTIVLVINTGKVSNKNLCIIRPNTGRSNKLQSADEIATKFKKITSEEAEVEWNKQYEAFGNMCLHRFVNGVCKKEDADETKQFCEFGRRFRTYFVLTGSVLGIWPILEKALNESRKQQSSCMQIVRISTDDKQKLVGLLVLPTNVRSVLSTLTKMCTSGE